MKTVFRKKVSFNLFIITLFVVIISFFNFSKIAHAIDLDFSSIQVIDADFDEPIQIYAVDIDEDGDMDVLGAASTADDITWWENDGNENFTEHTIDGSFDAAFSVFAIDIDGDSDIDVLGSATNVDEVAWWENDGSENFTKHVIDNTVDAARGVYAIDVDGDNDIDVLGTAGNSAQVIWWENDGNEAFTKYIIDTDFVGPVDVYAEDIDSDGDIDVLGAGYNSHTISWWENDGSENFTEHVLKFPYPAVTSVSALDINGDGDVDILGASAGSNAITWWENDGSENFTEHTIDSTFTGATDAYAIDMDKDGDIDIVACANTDGDIAWYENDGSESFTKYIIDNAFDTPQGVSAVDIDGDDDIDVVGLSTGGDTIAWWRNDSDLADPIISTLSPSDNATGVEIDDNLIMTFNETVATGTGNIILYKTSDDSVVETIDIAGALVTALGTTAFVVNPTSDLSYETGYYVTISATGVDDTAGNSYAGITASTTWSFTTEDTPTCPIIANTATYNAYPTCGVVTCNSGYVLSGGECTPASSSGIPAPAPTAGAGGADFFGHMGQAQNIGAINNLGVNIATYINAPTTFQTVVSNFGNQGVQDHKLEITNLDLFFNIATLTISSEPQELKIGLGEKVRVDLDGDGIDDVSVFFEDIVINRAEFTIKPLDLKNNIKTTDRDDNGETIEELPLSYEGKLISYNNSPRIYLVEANRKRWVISEKVFNHYKYKWSDVLIVAEGVVFEDGENIALEGELLEKIESVYDFARDLELGERGDDVKELQKYLNANGFIVAESGPGSRGEETNYFGKLTKEALIKFQKSLNLPAYGYFGKMTRALIN